MLQIVTCLYLAILVHNYLIQAAMEVSQHQARSTTVNNSTANTQPM